MNLEEFRKSMTTDAMREAEELRTRVAVLEHQNRKLQDEYELKIERLKNDCRCLCNRCIALTNGTMCIFCSLLEYRCEHELTWDKKFEEAKKLLKEDV